MNTFERIVEEKWEGKRLDAFLQCVDDHISRNMAAELITSGNIRVNGGIVKKSYKVAIGDMIKGKLPALLEASALPENIPLDIVYEDPYLLVVNKPKGMVTHPAPGSQNGTLVNALLFHCDGQLSGIGGVMRPGIVHRIDKNTSGLLIVAKTEQAHIGLSKQIKDHSFVREYQAVAMGRLRNDTGTIDKPIGRSACDRKKMCVTEKNSRQAVTHYEVIKRYIGYTHLRLRLETGRTHQIRVHLASIGHPIAGDDVYGGRYASDRRLQGQCLHAGVIGFVHPISGVFMQLESELPEYFTRLLMRLKPEK